MMHAWIRGTFLFTLLLSAAVQLGFGIALLADPARVLAWGGVAWTPALSSPMLNLGTLIVLCGAMSILAYRWTRRGTQEGLVLGLTVGATLLAMAVLHAAHGLYTPVAFDGARGLLLLGTGAWLWPAALSRG